MLALFSPSLNEAIQSGRAQITGSRRNAFLRHLLSVTEFAAAVVLLVAAGLLLKSFNRLTNVRSGFDPHNLLTAQVFLPSDRYSTESQQVEFATRLLERIGGLPEVRDVSISTSLPILLHSNMRVGIEGRPSPTSKDLASFVPLDSVSDAYFHTLGIPILSGRGFDNRDGPKTLQVAVVNRQFVRSFFPNGENPIGRRILLAVGSPDQAPVSIIGVSAAIRRAGPGGEPLPQIFLPQHCSSGKANADRGTSVKLSLLFWSENVRGLIKKDRQPCYVAISADVLNRILKILHRWDYRCVDRVSRILV